MTHTPTPWTHQGLEDEGEERGAVFIIGENLGGLVGAALPWATELNGDGFSRVVANAAFIVKAVNAHDELVAALKRVLTRCGPAADDRKQAEAALRKAGAL